MYLFHMDQIFCEKALVVVICVMINGKLVDAMMARVSVYISFTDPDALTKASTWVLIGVSQYRQ